MQTQQLCCLSALVLHGLQLLICDAAIRKNVTHQGVYCAGHPPSMLSVKAFLAASFDLHLPFCLGGHDSCDSCVHTTIEEAILLGCCAYLLGDASQLLGAVS